MKLFDFFKRRKPEDTLGPTELSAKEVPLSIQATPPKGTKFNRVLIYSIGGVFTLITAFSVITSLTPAKKLTPEEEAAKRFETGAKEKVQQYDNNAPDQLADMPANYASLSAFKDTQQRRAEANGFPMPSAPTGTTKALPPLGEPIPAVIGSIKQASQGSANSFAEQAERAQMQSRSSSSEIAISHEETKQTQEAMKSPISFGISSGGERSSAGTKDPQKLDVPNFSARVPSVPNIPDFGAIMGNSDQNMQDKKEQFLAHARNNPKNYVGSNLTPPVSLFELKAGSIIPIMLITGINSDLPGDISAQVTQNVYDTVTGHYLLVPQGTKVIGVYDSKVTYAQERVLVVWTRLIMPNGNSINLENMGGVDLSGYAGFSDKVNNHWSRIISGVVLSTALAVGAKVATGNAVTGELSIGQQAGSAAAEQVQQVGAKITQKNLNIQPTIEIGQGFKCNVFVNRDLVLKPYKL